MVSLIVPMYNAHDTIERCVNSIRNQTYEDWEAIIVDDASTDDSAAYCQKISKEDDRIRIYQMKENRGPAAARNYALTKIRGEWVSFIDSDDEIDGQCLEKAVEMADTYQADIVMWGLVNDRDGIQENFQRTFCGDIRVFTRDEMGYVIALLYTFKGEDASECLNLRGPVAKLVSAHMAKAIRFPEEINSGEDICYIRQLLDDCNRMVYFDEILYDRHIRNDSLSYSIMPDEGKRRADSINWMIRYNEETAKIKADVDYHQIIYDQMAIFLQAHGHLIPQMPYSTIRHVLNEYRSRLEYKIDYSQVSDLTPMMVKCVKRKQYYLYHVVLFMHHLFDQ